MKRWSSRIKPMIQPYRGYRIKRKRSLSKLNSNLKSQLYVWAHKNVSEHVETQKLD